jgi:hypothetical protein
MSSAGASSQNNGGDQAVREEYVEELYHVWKRVLPTVWRKY